VTIDKQLQLLTMVEETADLNLKEIRITLEDCQRLVSEPDRDMRAHIYHFMRQRLTGTVAPPPRQKSDAVEHIVGSLSTGDWIEYSNQMLQFASVNDRDELIALDNKGNERTIPKSQWTKIKKR
jgi:hypothetical protein